MSEIEKQFFKAFGIEPEYKICPFHHCIYKKKYDCDNCDDREWIYPQVTDRILLELICILASNPIRILFESMLSGIKEVELLKNSILLTCIANKDTIKHQVLTLFKECE